MNFQEHLAHNKKILELIKPGDVLLSLNLRHIVSQLIAKFTTTELTKEHGEASHSMLYIGNGKVVEANINGVGICLLEKYLNPIYIVHIYRIPDLTNKQFKNMHKFAYSKFGYKYGWLQAVYDAILYWLNLQKVQSLWIDIDENEYTCSEYIGEIIVKGGGIKLFASDETATFAPSIFQGLLKYVI